jgi:hypothetical protein
MLAGGPESMSAAQVPPPLTISRRRTSTIFRDDMGFWQ